MAKKKRKREERHRFAASSGRQFSLVNRGNRGWQLDVQIPGYGRVRQTVARGSREDARRQAIAIIENIERGLTATHCGVPPVRTIATDMLMWKLAEQQRAKTYVKAMASHFRHHILPGIGEDLSLADVTAAHRREFRAYLGALVEHGELDGRTCNRILTTLRQLYMYAEQRLGLPMPIMPERFPESPLLAPERWAILEPAQIDELVGHLPIDVRPLFTYVANTGVRIGSALATKPNWIDWSKLRVRYPASATKARRPCTLPLNSSAQQALRVALAASPEQPFPFSYWFAYKRWCEARVAGAYPTLRIHDLRHSFVSNQLEEGTPAHVVRDLAGHASIATTMLYAHSTDEARRAAVERVQVSGTLGPVPDPPKRPRDTKRDTKENPANAKSAGLLVGHPGLEPGANGLRIHCSTT
jgi:integrase